MRRDGVVEPDHALVHELRPVRAILRLRVEGWEKLPLRERGCIDAMREPSRHE